MADELKRVNGQVWITPETEKLCYYINGKLYEVSTSFAYETSAKVVKGNLLAIREGSIRPAVFPDDMDNIIGIALNSTEGGKKQAVSIATSGYLSLKSTELATTFVDKDLNVLNLGKIADKYIWETKASDGKLMGVGAPVYWFIGRTYKEGDEYKALKPTDNPGYLTIGTPSGYKWKREDIDDESLNVGYDNLPQIGTIESYTVKDHQIKTIKIHINVSRFDTSLEWSWPYIHDGKCGKLTEDSFLMRHGLFVDNSLGAQLNNYCDISSLDESGEQAVINTLITNNTDDVNLGNRGTTIYISTPQNLAYKIAGRVSYKFDKHHENVVQIINNNTSMGTIIGQTTYPYTPSDNAQDIVWSNTQFTPYAGYKKGEMISNKGVIDSEGTKITIPAKMSGSIYVYVNWGSETYNILINNSEVGGKVELNEESKHYTTNPDDIVYTIKYSITETTAGYEFKNFTTDKGKIKGNKLTVYGGTYGDITLSSHWQKTNHKIYINNTDINKGTAPTSYEYTPSTTEDQVIILKKSDLRPADGFEFDRYECATHVIDTTGSDPKLIIPHGTSEDITVNLYWKGIQYEIIYEQVGTEGTVVAEPTYYRTSLNPQEVPLNLKVTTTELYYEPWITSTLGIVKKKDDPERPGYPYYLELEANVHTSITITVSWKGVKRSIEIKNVNPSRGTITGQLEYYFNYSKEDQIVKIDKTVFTPYEDYSPLFTVDPAYAGSYNSLQKELVVNARVSENFALNANWDRLERISVTPTISTEKQYVGLVPKMSKDTKITAHYTEGKEEDVTGAVSKSPERWTSVTEQYITYSYMGKECQQQVTVSPAYIQEFTVGGEWSNTSQYLNESIDYTGLTYKFVYTDLTSKTGNITDSDTGIEKPNIWEPSSSEYRRVTFKKQDGIGNELDANSPEIYIVERPKDLVKLEVNATNWETQWAGKAPTKGGLIFTATYDSGNPEVLDNIKVTINYPKKWEATETSQEIEFSYTYTGKSTTTKTCKLTTTPKRKPISLSTGASEWSKSTQYVGDTVDTSGLIFTVTYEDGGSLVISDHSKITKYPTIWRSGDTKCKFTYTQNNITTQEIYKECTVVARPKQDIDISTTSSQTGYGDPYCSPSYFTVGVESSVTIYPNCTKSGYRYSRYTVTSDGTTSKDGFNLTIGSDCTQVSVTVVYEQIPVLTRIESSNTYDNEQYVGEYPDITGNTVWAYYDIGDRVNITDSVTVTASPVDTSGRWSVEVSNGKITYTYEGQKCTDSYITVYPSPPDYISIGGSWSATQYVGNTIDPTGLTATVYFKNGTSSKWTSGANFWSIYTTNESSSTWVNSGKQTATFKYSRLGESVSKKTSSVNVESGSTIQSITLTNPNGALMFDNIWNKLYEDSSCTTEVNLSKIYSQTTFYYKSDAPASGEYYYDYGSGTCDSTFRDTCSMMTKDFMTENLTYIQQLMGTSGSCWSVSSATGIWGAGYSSVDLNSGVWAASKESNSYKRCCFKEF